MLSNFIFPQLKKATHWNCNTGKKNSSFPFSAFFLGFIPVWKLNGWKRQILKKKKRAKKETNESRRRILFIDNTEEKCLKRRKYWDGAKSLSHLFLLISLWQFWRERGKKGNYVKIRTPRQYFFMVLKEKETNHFLWMILQVNEFY